MSVPDTETFSLTDITTEIGGGESSLQDCFDNAESLGFDPLYNNDGYAPANSMLRFRNYEFNEIFIQAPAYYMTDFLGTTENTQAWSSASPSVQTSTFDGVTGNIDYFTIMQLPTIPIDVVTVTVRFYVNSTSSTIPSGDSNPNPASAIYFTDWSSGTPDFSDINTGAGTYNINFPEGDTTDDVIIEVAVTGVDMRAYPSIAIGGLVKYGGEVRPDEGFYSVKLQRRIDVVEIPKISLIYTY
jgi:hypothetical protein